MDRVWLFQACRAITRRQFTFNHLIPTWLFWKRYVLARASVFACLSWGYLIWAPKPPPLITPLLFNSLYFYILANVWDWRKLQHHHDAGNERKLLFISVSGQFSPFFRWTITYNAKYWNSGSIPLKNVTLFHLTRICIF